MFRVQSPGDQNGGLYERLLPSDSPSHLYLRMSDCRKRFSEEYSLGAMTTMKTWGLASLDGYVAACVTIHPSSMIEYRMASAERATIVFSHSSLHHNVIDHNEDLAFPWEAKPLLKDSSAAHSGPWSTILSHTNLNALSKNPTSICLLYYTSLTSLLWQSNDCSQEKSTTKVLQMLAQSTNTDLSREIDLVQSFVLDSNNLSELLQPINSAVQSRSAFESRLPAHLRLVEYCQIPECQKPLFLTSNTYKARCGAGHTWSKFPSYFIVIIALIGLGRCALSFLAIQEPGVSKYCDTCGSEYLNEDRLLEGTTGATEVIVARTEDYNGMDKNKEVVQGFPVKSGSGATVSILQTLLNIYDVCIFCSGKFIS